MDELKNALPAEGSAKPAQNPIRTPLRTYETTSRERVFLWLTAAFCVLLTDTFLWHGPTAGMTAAVFAWYALVLSYVGTKPLALRSNRILLLFNLFLALTLALGSSWYFRIWNCLALLALLPLHALALSGAGRLPWHRPMMLWERLSLLLWGLFGHLGAAFAALSSGKHRQDGRRTAAWILGLAAAAGLVAILLPVLASADALFAAATADLRTFLQAHFSEALWKLTVGLVLTPFFFGLLYFLRHPIPLKGEYKERTRSAEAVAFLLILSALVLLYLLFLAVQSAGLFGGPEYLAKRNISYAQWARSGFFQMVGVTVVNLTVVLAALTFSRQEGRSWKLVRSLSAVLVAESLVLLASAAWRMTLYVTAYGLSFKRCLTYWGMAMMALFFLAALRKVRRPDFGFCRAAFPLALAGWLVINCVPVDFLVAKNQVDRYLVGESATVSVHYLAYSLSYDTLSQLERLDPNRPLSAYEGDWWGADDTLETLLAKRRDAAREECSDWHTWSLSACLAAMDE